MNQLRMSQGSTVKSLSSSRGTEALVCNQCLTCSAKFCDNLVVEADAFNHFRGIILCNAKCLQFQQNKIQEHRGTVHKVFHSPMLSPFLVDGVVGSVRVAPNFLVATVLLSFFIDAGKKLFFTQINSCVKLFNLVKIWRAHF